jgi:hypothetical protein
VKKTVVTILSTNFSGSHFLSLMLGSHSRATHVGEVKRLRKRRRSKEPCSACNAGECELFRGIEPRDLDELWPTLFSRVPDSVEVLVDNSKQPRWSQRYLGEDRYRMKYVHLIRDPRALMRRWATDYGDWRRRVEQRATWIRRRPDLVGPLISASHRRFFLYKWLAKNQQITRFIREHALDGAVVTYRDLAHQPEREVRRVARFLDLEFEAEQLEYWSFPHHGSQKPEYDWVKHEGASFIDLRWREFLSEADLRWAAREPRVARYLAALGLAIGDDGLTRR